MNDVSLQTILLLLGRHLAGSIAGAIIAHGWANGATSEQITGALLLVGSMLWSWWQKKGQALALADAGRAYSRLVALTTKKPPSPSVSKP